MNASQALSAGKNSIDPYQRYQAAEEFVEQVRLRREQQSPAAAPAAGVDITDMAALLNTRVLEYDSRRIYRTLFAEMTAVQLHTLAASTARLARQGTMRPQHFTGGEHKALAQGARHLNKASVIAHGAADRPNPHLDDVTAGVVWALREHRFDYTGPDWDAVELELDLARTYAAIHGTGA